MNIAPPTPKGFRDLLPETAKRKRKLIAKIGDTLENLGFQSMETPTVEFADALLGKYGLEADKLVYTFEDRGGRKLGLRYDLTVPLARFIASNPSVIANGPFSRFQTGQVFRGENPQKGRYREFTQADCDIVGSSDLKEDARVIAAVLACSKAIGIAVKMQINDRKNFDGLSKETIVAIDKLDKIGDEGVIAELKKKGIENPEEVLSDVKNKKPTADLEEIFKYLSELGVNEDQYEFVPTLARGLDYYTGSIFELRLINEDLSIGGGGRYDNLIGTFTGKQIPAVGFAFGIDRLLEVMP
jgi:histidyl-tRNA synthetase